MCDLLASTWNRLVLGQSDKLHVELAQGSNDHDIVLIIEDGFGNISAPKPLIRFHNMLLAMISMLYSNTLPGSAIGPVEINMASLAATKVCVRAVVAAKFKRKLIHFPNILHNKLGKQFLDGENVLANLLVVLQGTQYIVIDNVEAGNTVVEVRDDRQPFYFLLHAKRTRQPIVADGVHVEAVREFGMVGPDQITLEGLVCKDDVKK